MISADFVNYDDLWYVSLNEVVQRGITWQGIKWAFTTGELSNWHPVTWLSHMLDVQVFGMRPGWHHAVNVVLHASNSVLLLWLLAGMTGSVWRSALVAALFAWHPLHVESVAWISERKDVLSTFFGLWSLIAYLAYVRRGAWWRYWLSVALLAIGLMTKPMLVSWPFVMLLLDFWPLGRLRKPGDGTIDWPALPGLALEKAPMFLLVIAASAATVLAQGHGGSIIPAEELPLGERLSAASLAYGAYLTKTLWPRHLVAFYPHPGETPIAPAMAGLALLVTVTAIAWLLRRRFPHVLTGWLWYVGTLVPVIGIIQVGSQAFADRYTYVPLIGLFMILAWSIPGPWPSSAARRAVIGATACAALAVLLALTWRQAGYWRDSFALWRHALAVQPDNVLAHNNLALALNEVGYSDEAREHWRQSAEKVNYHDGQYNYGLSLFKAGRHRECLPYFALAVQLRPKNSNTHLYAGIALFSLGETDHAIEAFRASISCDPDIADAHYNLGVALVKQGLTEEARTAYRRAIELDQAIANAYKHLGTIELNDGHLDEALRLLSEAARLNPESAETFYNLGVAQMRLGQHDAAERSLKRAVELQSVYPEALFVLGTVRAQQHNRAGAIEAWEQLLRQKPEHVDGLNQLAWLLATAGDEQVRDGRRAVELAEAACHMTANQQPTTLDTLAAAYAESGRFDDAVRAQRQAIGLLKARNAQAAVADFTTRLRLYEQHQPYHE